MMLALAIPPVAVVFFVFYFLRSSKEMPKNWREFVLEMKIQASGTQGLAEDTFMRFRNRVGMQHLFLRLERLNDLLVLDLVKRKNKIAVITGGNRGIGLHVIEKLLRCEMTVMMGVRNPEGAKKQVEQAVGLELTEGKVFYEQCDTGDMESVKSFAKKVQQKFQAVHLLINNGKERFVYNKNLFRFFSLKLESCARLTKKPKMALNLKWRSTIWVTFFLLIFCYLNSLLGQKITTTRT